jgi:hypothetical protein
VRDSRRRTFPATARLGVAALIGGGGPAYYVPRGRKLVTLKDAIAWLAKEVPKSEHSMKEVQAAAVLAIV